MASLQGLLGTLTPSLAHKFLGYIALAQRLWASSMLPSTAVIGCSTVLSWSVIIIEDITQRKKSLLSSLYRHAFRKTDI